MTRERGESVGFDAILEPLLAAPGAIAAAFVDAQGQSIATAGDALALEVIGAYQPIWTAGLAGAAARGGLGELAELEMDFEERRILVAVVPDRYFLVVLFERSGVPSVAMARLAVARERLSVEIG